MQTQTLAQTNQTLTTDVLHDTNNTNIFLLSEKLSKLKSYTRIYVGECMQQRYNVNFYLKNKIVQRIKGKAIEIATKTEKKTRINTTEEEERERKTVVFVI